MLQQYYDNTEKDLTYNNFTYDIKNETLLINGLYLEQILLINDFTYYS